MLIDETILLEIESMNAVHRKEIEILNNLYKSIINKETENITENFDLFIENLKMHFDSEEKNMKTYNFPELMKHKMAHMKAVVEVRKAKTDWDKNKEPEILKQYFEEAFKPWLIRHIN
ncbi:MAG: hemerythrin family protein [Patescibacteria group bacterium]|nr:hemerythrin family protein [Patescibacteria group bacterium]